MAKILHIKKSQQNRSGLFGISIPKGKKYFYSQIKFETECYTKCCRVLEDAIEFRDMIAVYLYGKDAILNAPDKLDYYLNNCETYVQIYRIERERKKFLPRKPLKLKRIRTTHFKNLGKTKNGFICSVRYRDYVFRIQSPDEITAAQNADFFCTFFNLSLSKFNFPEKLSWYKENLEEFFNNYWPKKSSKKYLDVVYKNDRNKYMAKIKDSPNGKTVISFQADVEIDAHSMRKSYILKNSLLKQRLYYLVYLN